MSDRDAVKRVAEALGEVITNEKFSFEEKLIKTLGIVALQLSGLQDEDRLVAAMAAQIAGGMCAYSHPAHKPDVQLTERECDSIATSSVSMARRILAKVASHDDHLVALPPEGIAS